MSAETQQIILLPLKWMLTKTAQRILIRLKTLNLRIHTLEIKIVGLGSGTVKWGEDSRCEKNHSPFYNDNSKTSLPKGFTLNAKPDEKSALNGWEDDCSANNQLEKSTIEVTSRQGR